MTRRRILKAMSLLDTIEDRISGRWVEYNVLLVFLAVFLVPLTILSGQNNLFYLVAIVYFLFLIFADAKFRVGETNPKIFLKIERLRGWLFKSFWISLLAVIALFVLLLLLVLLDIKVNEEITKPVTYCIFFIFNGTWFYSITLRLYFVRREEFLKLRARVRLLQFSDSLSSENKGTIQKNISLLREGMQLINTFFREHFDFVIKQPTRLYNYVKLMTCTPDDAITEEIKDGLGNVINELKNKESDPLKILRSLRDMMGEPTSGKKDLFNDVEFERRFRKWVLVNLQIIIAIVEIVSGLIVVVSFIMGR